MLLHEFMRDPGNGTCQVDGEGPELTPEDVRALRIETNKMIIQKLDSEMGKVFQEETWEDVNLGHMTVPEKMTQCDIENLTLTRRLAVPEWSQHCGWRYRIVDHATESWLKSMTWAQHQCLNEMHPQILHMLEYLFSFSS